MGSFKFAEYNRPSALRVEIERIPEQYVESQMTLDQNDITHTRCVQLCQPTGENLMRYERKDKLQGYPYVYGRY